MIPPGKLDVPTSVDGNLEPEFMHQPRRDSAPPSDKADTRQRLLAGVELGGTKCICILASGPDDVRETIRVPTTTAEETLGRIRTVLERWKAVADVEAVGIGSFGPLQLNPRADGFGSIVSTPKPGWSGADLTSLALGLKIPVAIDTDVNGAALAEGRWGGAKDLRSFAYVTVGTGIGVGSIVGGLPVRGVGHSEAGHLRIARLAGDVWPGACPYHGDCVEGLAAGPALLARTGRRGETLAPDDPVWDSVVHALGGLFHNLVLTAAPEVILVGGGIITGNPHLLPRLRAALVRSLNGYAAGERISQNVEAYVASPMLRAMAGPLGAIALAATSLNRP